MIIVKSKIGTFLADSSLTTISPVRSIKGPLLLLLLTFLLSAVGMAHVATAETPTEGYLKFQKGVTAAATLQEALPYLSPEYRAMLESRPAESHPQWLERLKNAAGKNNIKVVKETINGKVAVLEATGTDSEGTALKGKISLVNENGAWLLDEQGWGS
jgi:hypothetical protein